MYSAYLDLSPARVRGARALGRISRRIYFGPLAPLRVRRFPTPGLPGGRWVRVRNVVSGIALDEVERTLVAWDPKVAPQAAPQPARVYLGRQVVGEIVETGSETQLLRVGDRVVYQSGPCCATREIEPPCHHCAAGSYALCENRYLPGPEQMGGGWSDEMIVHERQLFLTPDGLLAEQAALLEPTAEALRAALRYHPEPDDLALVLGRGGAGAAAGAGAARAGAVAQSHRRPATQLSGRGGHADGRDAHPLSRRWRRRGGANDRRQAVS